METFKIQKASKESLQTYSFAKILMIIGFSIIFFGLIVYNKLVIVMNQTIIKWSIYYFIGFIFMYLFINFLELKEGANNGN
jgi:uncharacterized membrane protein